MELNSSQVKAALIQIANKKGRPEYGLAVIREVLNAIKYNLPHDLKQLVLDEINLVVAQNPILIQGELSKLRESCKTDEDKSYLALKLGITTSVLGQIIRGRHVISPLLWKRIEPLLYELPSNRRLERSEIKNQCIG